MALSRAARARSRGDRDRYALVSAILPFWIARDPDGAWAWAWVLDRSLAITPGDETALTTVFLRALAKEDPRRAVGYVFDAIEGGPCDAAAQGLIAGATSALLGEGETEIALDSLAAWAQQGDAGSSALESAALYLSSHRSPEESAAWLD